MCGIAGIFHTDPRERVDGELLQKMLAIQRHRGPDGEGTREGPGYGLAHLRLAIVDLSPTGRQPMCGRNGDLWVTFNGEIYNYKELRAELEAKGRRFVSQTDTEVLLHGWDEWGTELPRRLRGMFAFALVDEREHTLFLARDRLGKKPLHFWRGERGIAFASEIKALLCDPRLPRALDHEALATYLSLRYVPDPKTIFAAIEKLPPAHWLALRGGKVEVQRYWRLSFARASDKSVADLHAETLERFDEAVRIRLMGDVPLGAFLSGGVDSFAVVESMSRATRVPVVACTIGFEEGGFDERPYARDAARQTGAVLHEGLVTAKEMLDLAWFERTFDEPFADNSAIPTYHVSRIARAHVTVALSGDGGDESYAGYRRYKYDRVENRVRRLLPQGLWRALGRLYPKADFLPRALRFKRTLENLAVAPELAYARSVSGGLPEQVLPLLDPKLSLAGCDPLAPVKDAYRAADGDDPLHKAIAADVATWLPGDILVKVDRASMAVALEVRAPFLDHVLMEHAAAIPARLKLPGGRSKGFLRDALAGRIDKAAQTRAKRGFSVPLRAWLVGPIGQALEDRLGEGRLSGLLDIGRVKALVARHRSGLHDHADLLWTVFCLDRFLARWVA